jgi:hypothetical protein
MWNVVDSIPVEVIAFFQIILILIVALGTGLYSASNRNEYQKQKNMFLGNKTEKYVSRE